MRISVIDHLTAIPVDDARLGRLVLDPLEPHQDFYDPPGSPNVSVKSQIESFENFRNSCKSTSIRSRLTRFLSAAFSDEKDLTTDVSAEKVEIHKLDNSGMWFREACKDAGVREWLEEYLNQSSDIYLIVGFCVLTTTKYDAKVNGDMTVSASASVPVPTTIVPDRLGASVAAQRIFKERLVALFPGQAVCAVQCRKLRFKWLSSRQLDKGFLEQGNRWKLSGAFRGEEDSDEEDVLEADVGGSSDSESDSGSDDGDEE